MKMLRSELILMFQAAGYKSAGRWSKDRMNRMLKEVVGLAEKDGSSLEDEKLDVLLKTVVYYNGEIEVLSKLPKEAEELLKEDVVVSKKQKKNEVKNEAKWAVGQTVSVFDESNEETWNGNVKEVNEEAGWCLVVDDEGAEWEELFANLTLVDGEIVQEDDATNETVEQPTENGDAVEEAPVEEPPVEQTEPVKDEPAKDEAPKSKKPRKKKDSKAKRHVVCCSAITEHTKKKITIEELSCFADSMYVDKGGKSNANSSMENTRWACEMAEEFGLVKLDGDTVVSV